MAKLQEQLAERDETLQNGRKSYGNLQAELRETKETSRKLEHLLAAKEETLAVVEEQGLELKEVNEKLKTSIAEKEAKFTSMENNANVAKEQLDLLEKDVIEKKKMIRALQVNSPIFVSLVNFHVQNSLDEKSVEIEELQKTLQANQVEMANQKLALADNDMLIQAEKNERSTAEAEMIKELESLRAEKVGLITKT